MIFDINDRSISPEMLNARIVDLDTGEDLRVFYADDEAGIYRLYLKRNGHEYVPEGRPYREICYLADPYNHKLYPVSPPPEGFTGRIHREYEPDEHGIVSAWEERRGRIKIIPGSADSPDDPPRRSLLSTLRSLVSVGH